MLDSLAKIHVWWNIFIAVMLSHLFNLYDSDA